MKVIKGESKAFLHIDLTEERWSILRADEEVLNRYLGGKGLGLKLFYDLLGGNDGRALDEIDPLGPENMLCFMMGTFMATGAPCSARFAGVTKSPLTGIMTSSSCGGPFGIACKTAGWDGVLIRGRSSRPVVLQIDEDGVRFEDAGELWGMETGEAQKRLLDNPRKGALVIGPAGENGVLYSVIRSGNRYLGRGGLGTVMGAKQVKAVIALGRSYRIEPVDPVRFERLNRKAKRYMERNPFIQSYRAYGTNFSIRPGIKAGFVPVRNFRDRTDPRCEALSGEAMAERYHTEHAVCAPCSILCGHKGTWPDGTKRHIPEYETIGLWGGNLMNFDPDIVGIWNDRLGELGIDTISCGATVGWAMEASEKGLRPSELSFGKTDNIVRIIEDIAYRRGEGEDLSLGTRQLAEKYGGGEFAIQVKGLEIAAYDPRAAWGQGLNYAVANRGGCHLSAYPVALEAVFGYIPPYSTLAKASWVNYFEDLFAAVNSLQSCQFTTFGYLLEPPIAKYTPKPLLKLAMTFLPDIAQLVLDLSLPSGLVTAITGRKIGPGEFKRAGRRVHILERQMNCLMGVSRKADTLPERFLKEADTAHPVKSVVPLKPLLDAYYRKKGYGENGLPRARTLSRLGIGPPEGERHYTLLAK